ncbi:MmgE/PrpD family protein [Streptacidiphilus sp. PAMC 29251]
MAETLSLAQELAALLARIDLGSISPRGRQMALAAFTDTVCVALAGSVEPAAALLRQTLPTRPGPALLLGTALRADVLDAAQVNGTAGHALDFDDMAAAMGGHPSVPVIPVVLALGESLHASGADVVEAYIVGFEAESRLGKVVHPHHYETGWHPTSTLGVFGAAAAAARLLGLDVERTATALAISASSASGVKANFGTMTKPLHAGNAARAGLLAALLAERGYTADLFALEKPQGFLAAYDGLDNTRPQRLVEPTDRWEIEGELFGLKQFPCCGSTHPAILAALDIVSRTPLTADDIARVEIRTHHRRLGHTDNPAPASALAAKFSIQYAVVRALLEGAVRLGDFEGVAYRDPDAVALLARTTALPAPDSDDPGAEMAAQVTVTTRDGATLHGQVSGSLGRGPADPMTEQEMWRKFQDCALRILPADCAGQAFEALSTMLDAKDIASVTALLQVPEPGGPA